MAALPDLMRAAGHYPSEADKGSLLAHVRFLADMAPADDAAVCSTSGARGGSNPGSCMQQPAASAGVDLDTFLLLYLSHRPVVDFDRQQVEAAFKALGATTAAGRVHCRGLLLSKDPIIASSMYVWHHLNKTFSICSTAS